MSDRFTSPTSTPSKVPPAQPSDEEGSWLVKWARKVKAEHAAKTAAAGVDPITIHKGNPYHEPAGSPKGGQFASKPGGPSVGEQLTDQLHQYFLLHHGIDLDPKAKAAVEKFFSGKSLEEFQGMLQEHRGPQAFAALAAKTFSPLLVQPEAVAALNSLSMDQKMQMARQLGEVLTPYVEGKWKAEDFKDAGLYIADFEDKLLNTWNKLFPDTSPAELVKMFDGWPGEGGVFSIGRSMTKDEQPDGGIQIERRTKSEGNSEANNAIRMFRPTKSGGLYVDHDYFFLNESDRGYGKRFLRQSIDLYKKLGVKQVITKANIDVGGYAWARYGFVPSDIAWKKLKNDLFEAVMDGPDLGDDASAILKKALKDESPPKDLWKIADIHVVGKKLLMGSEWNGVLNLTDKETMARFDAYVNHEPTPLKKFNPHHEPAGSSKGGQFASKPGGSLPSGQTIAETFSGSLASLAFNFPGAPYPNDAFLKLFKERIDYMVSKDLFSQGAEGLEATNQLTGAFMEDKLKAADPVFYDWYRNLGLDAKTTLAESWQKVFDKTKIINPNVTAEDFKKRGIRIPVFKVDDVVKAWQRTIPVSPKELFDTMFDFFPEGTSGMEFTADVGGDGLLVITGKSEDDEDRNVATRFFQRVGGKLVVTHDFFALSKKEQEHGFSKQFLKQSMELYKKMGVSHIKLHANISVGGYAWAKYGFVPSPTSWQELRNNLAGSPISNPEARERVESLVKSKDPKSIWGIADMKGVGKVLLLKSDWEGSLDLSDKEAMERFNRYVSQQ